MKELAPQASRKHPQKHSDGVQGWGNSTSSPNDDNNKTLWEVRPQQHHHISIDVQYKIHLSTWLNDAQDDPTLEVRLGYQLDEAI
jgi:hypothetical protein